MIGKQRWNPPQREAYIEDEGDAFGVSLLEDGIQVGGAFFPDDGDGTAYDQAAEVAQAWIDYQDRMRDDRKARMH